MKVTDKEYISGWYAKERDDQGPFRWMGKEALVSLLEYPNPDRKFLRITAGHSFPEKELPILEVFVNDRKIGSREIEAAFTPYVFSFESSGDLNIEFKLSRTVQVYGDPREMGVMYGISKSSCLLKSESSRMVGTCPKPPCKIMREYHLAG